MKQINQILTIVLILIILGAGGFLATRLIKQKNDGKIRESVFLTNGQVYFGYVSRENNNTLTLKNIYYLQVQQPLQPAKDTTQPQPQISLVKLGNELHGPQDEMVIYTKEVLFREKMKADSKVNQAIADYEKNGGNPTAPAATPAPQATK